jgi:integrase
MITLAQQDGLGALALRFTILTCTRTNESLKARWGEFDLAERLWIIPAERMKMEREQRKRLRSRDSLRSPARSAQSVNGRVYWPNSLHDLQDI